MGITFYDEQHQRARADDLGLMILGVMNRWPLCRGKVQNMVAELCRGLKDDEIMAAFQGLLAVDPHVRAVALSSIPQIPLLAEGTSCCQISTVQPSGLSFYLAVPVQTSLLHP